MNHYPRNFSIGGVIVWILIGISVFFVLLSLSIPAITAGPTKPSPAIHALSNVRQLSLAIENYASDQKNKSLDKPEYPDDLHQLVNDGYLSQNDFEKLTKDIQLSYFPPKSSLPSSNHLLLVAHIHGFVIYCPVSGKPELQKIP
jgi:hypothetical protein